MTNISAFSRKLKYKVISIKGLFDTNKKKKKTLPSTIKFYKSNWNESK